MNENNAYKLYDGEYRFASVVWDNEPLSSGELVRLCGQVLGWKKSTTYTVLKKLCERGILQNNNSTVTALIKREQVQRYQSKQIIDHAFGGSLPQFVASFINGRKLSPQEVEELRALIEQNGKEEDEEDD